MRDVRFATLRAANAVRAKSAAREGAGQAGGTLGAGTLQATVVGHGKTDKIIVFKKKRRKQYKRRQGHRQGFTEITID